MRLRWLDRFLDPGRRRRARRAAAQFEAAESRAAAERVFFFLERIAGVRSAEVNLDAPVAAVLAGATETDRFWDIVERAVVQGDRRRLHAFENLRSGTVRHLINHLAICRVCRPEAAPGEASAWPHG
jgi:hypothetical protein